MGKRGHLSDLVDTDVVRAGKEAVDDRLGPVRSIREQAQVAQRLLRATELILPLRQLVRKLDQQLAPSATLSLRQRKDASDIV